MEDVLEEKYIIDVDHVTMRFNMPKEKVDNIKEFLIKALKNQLR